MKKLATLACAVAVVGLILAPVTPALAAAKTHDMNATVISIDLDMKELTFENMDGKTMTAPVLEKALKAFEALKKGDKITVTCQDTEEGKHEGLSKIETTEKKA